MFQVHGFAEANRLLKSSYVRLPKADLLLDLLFVTFFGICLKFLLSGSPIALPFAPCLSFSDFGSLVATGLVTLNWWRDLTPFRIEGK